MYEFRQVIVRMRLGESDRAIAKSGLMGRAKCAGVRTLATAQGWLDASQPLPDDEALSKQLTSEPPDNASSQVSRVEPYRQEVEQWHEQGIAGTTIYQALIRKHHFTGSYSSVRRFLQSLDHANRPVTSVIEFMPGDSAQIDSAKHITKACIGNFFRSANWHSLRSFYANLLHSKNSTDAGVIFDTR